MYIYLLNTIQHYNIMKGFSIVVAATNSFGIGRKGDLPWKIAEDMNYFKKLTTSIVVDKIYPSNLNRMNVVIMGRKTYESIPTKFRPLAGRLNVILSKNENLRNSMDIPDNVIVSKSLSDALELLATEEYKDIVSDVFVIGGGQIYSEAIHSSYCSKIYLTEILTDIPDLDTFFPTISANKFVLCKRSPLHQDQNHSYRFTEYARLSTDTSFDLSQSLITSMMQSTSPSVQDTKNIEELQYLNLIQDIITNGVYRGDRTGTGTLSKFGVQMRFSLRDNIFPLLTTKKVFWRGVAEELIWFVRGCTNGKLLSDKGIHIWDGNGSREFLDSRGLFNREVGDLGPVYGFQWRHFGANYQDMHSNYEGQGVDQLLDCIQKLKKSPEDRRIIMSAWNPSDLDKMALPPCHMFCQFYVANNELSCQMYQRSADMGLGVPFNIASYSLLTAMVAQVCDLKCGEFIHTIGDAHVYANHVDALKEQLQRIPKEFPKLFLNPSIKDIDKFEFSDFTIEGYNPEGIIKMKMAV